MNYTQVHHNPDVFEILVPFKNLSTNATNCYVVIAGEDALVVDTGAPTKEGGKLLAAALDELGIDRKKATYFLTHLHLDHAGLVDYVVPEGARVCMSKKEVETVRYTRTASFFEDMRQVFEGEGLPFIEASGLARYAIEMPLLDANRIDLSYVGEGDEILVGDYRFVVVETPGHTTGHLSLFEPESRIMFGGDHILFVISPSIALFPDKTNGLHVYLTSLQKVRDLKVSKLFWAHGEARSDFHDRIDWLEKHHLDRLEETAAIVSDNPGLSGQEVIRRIKWNVPHDAWEDISFIQRWCITSEGIVFLDRLIEHNRIRCQADEHGINRYYDIQSD